MSRGRSAVIRSLLTTFRRSCYTDPMSLQTLLQLHILLCFSPLWTGYCWVHASAQPFAEGIWQFTECRGESQDTRAAVIYVLVRRCSPAARLLPPNSTPSLQALAAVWLEPALRTFALPSLSSASPRAP